MGCSALEVNKGLASFKSLPHRLSLVRELNGVKFIDDSKATNVGAVCSALAALSGQVILIAGGRDKQGGFEILKGPIQQKVKNLLLIGEARQKMAKAFDALTNIELLESMAQAVERAWQIARPGDVVLLSPACASFDMFRSYSERGQVFSELVDGLEQG